MRIYYFFVIAVEKFDAHGILGEKGEKQRRGWAKESKTGANPAVHLRRRCDIFKP